MFSGEQYRFFSLTCRAATSSPAGGGTILLPCALTVGATLAVARPRLPLRGNSVLHRLPLPTSGRGVAKRRRGAALPPPSGEGGSGLPAARNRKGSSRSLVGADVLGGPPKAFPAHGEGGAKRCHCEPVLTLVWQSVYSVPRRGCPFLLLVQKEGTKENDTREGKISISPPPWILPHSNDQTELASPFWISPGNTNPVSLWVLASSTARVLPS